MIQWYPGHMAKAIREINEKIKLVDIVIVLLDARIPLSSMNPELKKLFQNKLSCIITLPSFNFCSPKHSFLNLSSWALKYVSSSSHPQKSNPFI